MRPVSLGAFQASQRRGRALLEEELEDLIPAPDPEPEIQDDEDAEKAELEDALNDARDFLDLPHTATREEVQAGFAEQLDAFGRFFFAHYHEDEETGAALEPSRMHAELQARIQDLVLGRTATREEAFACPREHGKSVTGTVKGVIWAVAHRHRVFPIIFSDTGSQASGFLEDVRDELEGNTRLRAVYPDLCRWPMGRNGREMEPRINPNGLSRILMANGTVIMAAGSGKAMRGVRKGARRPDWIIADDIESDDEVENPKRRAKKMRWWNKVAKKLGRRAVYLILGTILHADSFLARRIGDDDARIYRAIEAMPADQVLWAAWEKVFHDRAVATVDERERRARAFYDEHRAAMDAGAVVLWPARFTLYDLMVERAEDYASFLSERQNDPFDPAGCYFPEDKLQFLEKDQMPAADDVVASVAFWDPSAGQSKSDTSAVPRLDALRDGRRLVSWAHVGRFPPEEVVETIVGAHKLRPFLRVGVEKVALSDFEKDLERVAHDLGLALPVEPVTPRGSKDLRIKSQRPLVVSGGLVFAGDLPIEAVQQVKYYPQHPNDDLWDAIKQANDLLDELLAGVAPAAATREVTETAITAADAFGRERMTGDPMTPASLGHRDEGGMMGGFLSGLFDRMWG